MILGLVALQAHTLIWAFCGVLGYRCWYPEEGFFVWVDPHIHILVGFRVEDVAAAEGLHNSLPADGSGMFFAKDHDIRSAACGDH